MDAANMQEYEIHPVAEIFPPLAANERAKLKEDISENGQLAPILVHEGKIIDGRHRYEICRELGIEPIVQEWDGRGGSPIAVAAALNMHRRRMTKGQLAMAASDSLPFFKEAAKGRQRQAALRTNGQRWGNGEGSDTPQVEEATEDEVAPFGPDAGEATMQAGHLFGVSKSYVAKAVELKMHSPLLADSVRAGKLTLTNAEKLWKQSPENNAIGDDAQLPASITPRNPEADYRPCNFLIEAKAALEQVCVDYRSARGGKNKPVREILKRCLAELGKLERSEEEPDEPIYDESEETREEEAAD